MVKRFGRRISVGTASLLIVVGGGAALPASADTIESTLGTGTAQVTQPQPEAQAFTASPSAPLVGIDRDGYTISAPPPPPPPPAPPEPTLQYPLLTGPVTSGYGPRGGRLHEGTDIAPAFGTPVYSIAAGVVVQASGAGAYGNHVTVEHVIDGQMVTSLYAHMAPGTMAVSVGDRVGTGQQLGGVGETGNAQGAHLHFEIRPGGQVAVDPYAWLGARI
ncbi:MAG: M23 family metallopeptidase [Homoserinimonas sp.]